MNSIDFEIQIELARANTWQLEGSIRVAYERPFYLCQEAQQQALGHIQQAANLLERKKAQESGLIK